MTFKKGYTPHNKGKKGPSGKDHPMYGKKHSEKARLKISLAGKGRKAWNKGKKGPSGKDHPMYGRKHSEKSIRKMSKSKKGQTHSEATKRKMKGRIPWNKGKKGLMKSNSGSFKKGQPAWNKGKKGVMPEPWNRGKKGVSEETWRRMSKAQKGKKLSEKHKKILLRAITGRTMKDETRTKIGNKNKINYSSPERRQFFREKRLHQVFPAKDTKIEKLLQSKLHKKGIKFEKHKPILGQPDIFIEPNICIFADGDYWHGWFYLQGEDYSKQNKFNNAYFENKIRRDVMVTNQLTEEGYAVLRFWEHEINENPEKCIQKILKAIK